MSDWNSQLIRAGVEYASQNRVVMIQSDTGAMDPPLPDPTLIPWISLIGPIMDRM
jgi:hypothetical protein